jgi:hypothetical protein
MKRVSGARARQILCARDFFPADKIFRKRIFSSKRFQTLILSFGVCAEEAEKNRAAKKRIVKKQQFVTSSKKSLAPEDLR